jgi:hypothetical protein
LRLRSCPRQAQKQLNIDPNSFADRRIRPRPGARRVPNPPADDENVERPEAGEDDPALMAPVLEALKTFDVWEAAELQFAVQDPEIPVNLVELGLIYELIVSQGDDGGARVTEGPVRASIVEQGAYSHFDVWEAAELQFA